MSHSHECRNCYEHTKAYDDAYCSRCQEEMIKKEKEVKAKQKLETELVILLLNKLGFDRQARILRKNDDAE